MAERAAEVMVTFVKFTALGLQTCTLKVTGQTPPQPGSRTLLSFGFPSRSQAEFSVTVQVTAAVSTWATALSELNTLDLDPKTINDTLGVLLKYQDDIARMQGSEAADILRKVKADIAAQPLG